MRLRSAVTVRPVLGGFVPPATVTVSRVDAPACRLFGFAEPVPVGGVVRGVTVSGMDALRAAGLCVGDGRRQGLAAAQGVGGHGGLEGEDVVVGGGVTVRSIVEEWLRRGAADGGEIGGDPDAGAGGVETRA